MRIPTTDSTIEEDSAPADSPVAPKVNGIDAGSDENLVSANVARADIMTCVRRVIIIVCSVPHTHRKMLHNIIRLQSLLPNM